MIFCHTRKTVNWLVEKMTAEGHAVALLSGELTVEERLVVLDRWSTGRSDKLKAWLTCPCPGSETAWKRFSSPPMFSPGGLTLNRSIDISPLVDIHLFVSGDHCGELRPSSGRERQSRLRDILAQDRQDRQIWKGLGILWSSSVNYSTFQHGLAINLVDGPKSMAVLKEIERHFGKDIAKLDAEDVDEIEKLNQEWYYVPPVRIFRLYIPVQVVARQKNCALRKVIFILTRIKLLKTTCADTPWWSRQLGTAFQL